MQFLKQSPSEQSQDFDALAALKKEFQSLVEKQTPIESTAVQPVSTRIVRVMVSSCCGCGCVDVEITRSVPIDSSIKDGDYVGAIQDGDQLYED
jgi:hypothetical protein